MSLSYSPEEMMTIVAARSLTDRVVCFVGIGLPSAAANLARQLHAPHVTLVYESGTIGSKPDVLPLSIGDGELAETADSVVSLPEIFAYWLQGRRVDVGFLGAAQIDRFGNLNTTVIGPYDEPCVRLPGAGGAPEIATSAGEVFVVARHRPQTFVAELDFVTSPGRSRAVKGPNTDDDAPRGVTQVITDIGVLEPDIATGELELTHVHPGITVEAVRGATGWPLQIAHNVEKTPPPTDDELMTLRDLHERTKKTHAESAVSG